MRKSILLIFSLSLAVGLIFTVNCSMDESSSSWPEPQLTDQVVSIAVGNGNNTVHSGESFLLDWNGDSAEDGTNPEGWQTIPVQHVASESPTVENYYVLTNEDGEHGTTLDEKDIIDPVWETVEWTTLNLTLIDESIENYGPYTTYPYETRSVITQLKVKAIYNYQRQYIAFLFQWDDSTKDYMKGFWHCIDADYFQGIWQYGEWERNFDYDSDWLSMMFSTWETVEEDDDIVGFDEVHTDFQQQGCNTTCHDDGGRPYHYNEQSTSQVEICDLWYWGASRTNYGDPTGLTELGGEMFDGRIDVNGGVSGDYNDPDEVFFPDDYAGETCDFGYLAYDRFNFNFRYDNGAPNYLKNSWRIPQGPNIRGYTHWWIHPGNVDDGTLWFPYLWAPPAGIGTTRTYGAQSPDAISYRDDMSTIWIDDVSNVTGYVNRAAMGNCVSIRSTGVYTNGMWTLEIVRDLETGDADDVNLNIYVPAGD